MTREPAGPAAPSPGPEGPGLPHVPPARPAAGGTIVHITDIHAGAQFNETVWASFLDTCADLRPDILLVTGDLVDSPWRWGRGSLARAREKLYEARRRIDEARAEVGAGGSRLIVVPGNHDTRIRGVAPLRRLFTPLAACLVIAVAAAVLANPFEGWRSWFLLGAVVAMALVWLAYAVPFDRFHRCFAPSEAITAPTAVPCDGVTVLVLPFDSASFPIVLAGGQVQLDEFVRTRRVEAAPPSGVVYRLAALHHHPLPIPYDDALEETLVLRNAGAFLLEMAKLDVRLILHGHKHHWNFGRAPVDIRGGEVREVAVLGGSTLTRGLGRADGDAFGFNAILVDARGSARVTRYTSAGGPFDVEREFDVERVQAESQWLQRTIGAAHGVACLEMIDTTEINLDGDAERRWEVRGFRVVDRERTVDAMPGGRAMAVSVGHIERVEARPMSANGPRLLKWEYAQQALQRHEGRIAFGRPVAASEAPFDFFRRWHEVNSHAMTTGQFRRMYPSEPAPAYEFVSVKTPVFPCEKFRLSVYFPGGFQIDGHPDLEVIGPGGRIARLEAEWRPALFYSALDTALALDVAHPPPDVQILIRWRLVDRDPPEGLGASSLQGEAKELARWLLAIRKDLVVNVSPEAWADLVGVIAEVEDNVRALFRLPPPADEPLEVSIAAYDPAEEKLRVVLANFPPESPAWRIRLAYGDGIAGRAYKANKTRWFVKARAEQTNSPYYYYPARAIVTGQPPVVDGEHIEDEVVVSVPLTHSRDPKELYGVLSVSSRRPSSPLVDQDAGSGTRVILEALNQFCFERLVARQRPARPPDRRRA